MTSVLDTNVLLRYLLGDSQAKSVEKIIKSREKLVLLDIVVAEVVWTLSTAYKWRKDKIISLVISLLKLENIEANRRLLLSAIDIYKGHSVKYTDAYIVSLMSEINTNRVYSYDRDFDKIPGVRRIEPK